MAVFVTIYLQLLIYSQTIEKSGRMCYCIGAKFETKPFITFSWRYLVHGRYEKVKQKKPLGGKKILLIVLAVLLALIAAAVIAGVIYYNRMLDKVTIVEVPKIQTTQPSTEPVQTETVQVETTEGTVVTTEPPHIPSSADYINFLVVGQAGRDGEAERFADTMILCTVNTYEKTLTMTSLLRDSFVRPPNFRGREFGRIKLTSVYHLGSFYDNGNIAGSMELMNQTLYNEFGIEVDYNFEIDFNMFMDVINLMGGVSPMITQAEADYLNAQDKWVTYEIYEGYNNLDGSAALTFARMRKAEGDADSDIKRTERQRRLISAVIKRLRELSVSEVQSIIDTVLPQIITSMSKTEITDMIVKLLPMLPELQIKKGGTCPVTVDGTQIKTWGDLVDIYDNGQLHSVMRFQNQKEYMRAITEGEGLDKLPEQALALINGN